MGFGLQWEGEEGDAVTSCSARRWTLRIIAYYDRGQMQKSLAVDHGGICGRDT